MLEPRTALTFLLCIGLMVSGATMLEAAEIKVIAGAAFSPAMRELEPQFERESGHTVKIQYGIAGTIKRMIEAREPFDLAILPIGQLNDLAELGRIVEETRIPLVRVGMVAGTRAGAPRPDIASVEGFKRALLDAK
ncbi:MAG: substrate-binding domain-containing protein, partial [Alphaproteobacteria bacterium]|nr:substrate-binding domain-containing protein [Alphaproteobacteria bacterium]